MAIRAEWTTTPPEEPGFHWWHRTEEITKTTIVEVTKSNIGLVMQFFGDDSVYDLSDFECLWGPRIEPMEVP